jgi:hypothetical protein
MVTLDGDANVSLKAMRAVCRPISIQYREGGASHRVLHGALSRLEPCAVKVARTVLRGRGDRKVTLLPDYLVCARQPRGTRQPRRRAHTR